MSEETATAHHGDSEREPARFDAILQPHASLPPRGFFLLMAAVGTVSFAAGTAFVLIGAWPVFGFFGLDALLVYGAFRLNYRAARRYETVRLTDSALLVERVAPSGNRERWKFQPYWLRVELEDHATPRTMLTLRSHGRVLEIGSFLSLNEKAELAGALRDALDRVRNPAIAAYAIADSRQG